jgi:hypothetical protein
MASDYTTETIMRVYHNHDGWFYEVRPDTDGCDGIEIRYSDGDDKSKSIAMMPRGAARELAAAILRVADDIDAYVAKEAP